MTDYLISLSTPSLDASCKPLQTHEKYDNSQASLINPTALQKSYRIDGNLLEFLIEIIDRYLREAPNH